MNKTISEDGENLIISFENEILKGYLCPAGVLTIGIGHVVLPNENFRLGQMITREESRRIFRNDLQKYVDAVNSLVKVELSQNQFDAIVSFVFNVGKTTFRKSSVLRLLNERKFIEAANFLLKYVYADGKQLKGLVRRRKAERELFLS